MLRCFQGQDTNRREIRARSAAIAPVRAHIGDSGMFGLIKGLNKALCPYCFRYFRLRNMPFRCVNHKCGEEKDAVREETWGERTPTGKVIPPAGRFTKRLPCHACGERSATPICPKCHLELPYAFGVDRNYVFAVIGAKETGKSNYIAVLVHRIRELGQRLNFLLSEADDYTIARYRRDFREPLFGDGNQRVVDVTQSATAEASRVKRPLLFNLIVTRGSRKISGNLAFFDSAGEDFSDEKTMENVHEYICQSDGIILLIDPLQLAVVRRQVANHALLPDVSDETREIVNRTTRVIRKAKSLDSERKKIPIPIAVAFSKFDMLETYVPEGLQANNMANHDGGFDVGDFEAVNDELKGLLEDDWGESDIVNQVATHYSNYGFFAVSALGCNPVGGRLPRHVLPWRVEDPFLWLLAQNGLLRSARSQ